MNGIAFSPEFKAEAVQLCKIGDRSIVQIAKELALTENALREWVNLAEHGCEQEPTGRSHECGTGRAA